jgi:hypothetical protein
MNYLCYHLFRFIYIFKRWLAMKFTATGRAVLLGLVVSAVIGIDTKQTMAYQIFTLLLAILVLAMASSLFFRCRFNATRILPRFGTAGVKLTYRIVLHNKTSRIQTDLKIFEHLEDPCPNLTEFIHTPEPDEKKRAILDKVLGYYRWVWLISRKQHATTKVVDMPSIQPNSETEVVMEITPSHRGVIRLPGLTVARPDPFGLFNAFTAISVPQSLLVLPKRYDLPAVRLRSSRRYQSGGVALASSVGDSEEFVSLRDYRPGDPLRRIHWKSWAKIGKPVVKEYQDEFFVRYALILDTFQTSDYSEILEEAVSIAASFACELQTQESLLDLMFVGSEAYCFTSGRGLAHTDKMLEILAAVIACRDKSFAYLTPVVISRAYMLSGCICVFLSWDEERKKLIGYLKGLDIPIMVLVITAGKDIGEALDPGPMKDKPENFHVLKLEKIQEGLMTI